MGGFTQCSLLQDTRSTGKIPNHRSNVFLTDAFPSSAAFDLIASSLNSNEADKKDAIKQGKAVFAFTLKNPGGDTESWYIDLKETGTVGKGPAPEGKKADGMCDMTNYYSFPEVLLFVSTPLSIGFPSFESRQWLCCTN